MGTSYRLTVSFGTRVLTASTLALSAAAQSATLILGPTPAVLSANGVNVPFAMQSATLTVATPIPAWRTAMSATNTLYYASAGAPTTADGTIVWPGGAQPYGQNAEMGWWTMVGYSGGYFVPGLNGAHGSLIIGTGGHDAMGTELLRYNLSQDSPTFDWWQQPTYQTSDTGNVDIYYSPSVMAGLDAAHNMNDGDWASWVAAGKTYPCGYNGWIYPRPIQGEEVADQTPKGFRFYCMAYIPPSMTGTADGALIKARSNQGPWSQGGRPLNAGGANIPVTDWYDPAFVMAGGADYQVPIYAKNTTTGAWTRLSVKDPVMTRSSSYIPSHVHACVPKKRVYVWTDATGGSGFYYLDFTSGLAGVTVSSYINPALGSAHAIDPYAGVNVISIDGRNLAFAATLNDTHSVLWYDLDSSPNQFVVGPIPGFTRVNLNDERWIWDAANRRIIIVGHSNAGAFPITYQTITVPADITNAAGYVASTQINLATAAGVTVDTSSWMYGKVFLHPTLNCIFVPQDRHKMLAFLPG